MHHLDQESPDALWAAEFMVGYIHARHRLDEALFYALASVIPIQEVYRELGTLSLDRRVGEVFVQRLQLAMAEAEAGQRALDPTDRLFYVDVPAAVVAESARRRAAFAPAFAAFEILYPRVRDAIENRRATLDLLTESVQLRDSYLRQCTEGNPFIDCLGGPIAYPLTESIVVMAALLERYALAQAEHDLLDLTPDTSMLLTRIQAAQQRVREERRARYEAYQTARRRGESEDALRIRFGPEPPSRDAPPLSEPHLRRPNLRSLVRPREGGRVFAGTVARDAMAPSTAQVSFEPVIHTDDVPYACRDTNRVSRIDRDGRVIYEERCRYRRQQRRTQTSPVTLPRSEAAHLRRGEYAMGYEHGEFAHWPTWNGRVERGGSRPARFAWIFRHVLGDDLLRVWTAPEHVSGAETTAI